MVKYPREKTRKIKVGTLHIGGSSKVIVQSMTNTKTYNVESTVNQILELQKAGCELVRVSVPDLKSVEALALIKKKINIPIVADVHYNFKIALEALRQGADKIRINPGNMKKHDLENVIKSARDKGVPIRIGVNSGSLQELHKNEKISYKEQAKIMVNKVLSYIDFFEKFNFKDIIVALKSTDIKTTIEANTRFANIVHYPLHLGITEAGPLFSGIIKSSVGLGMLLNMGIGNTLRVSLSSDPLWEVRVAYKILQCLGLSNKLPEIVSCPTCSRTTFDVIKMSEKLENYIYSLDLSKRKEKKIKIAIMGCIVNGPLEAKSCDFGFTGAGKKVCLFVKGKIVKSFDKSKLNSIFEKEIKKIC